MRKPKETESVEAPPPVQLPLPILRYHMHSVAGDSTRDYLGMGSEVLFTAAKFRTTHGWRIAYARAMLHPHRDFCGGVIWASPQVRTVRLPSLTPPLRGWDEWGTYIPWCSGPTGGNAETERILHDLIDSMPDLATWKGERAGSTMSTTEAVPMLWDALENGLACSIHPSFSEVTIATWADQEDRDLHMAAARIKKRAKVMPDLVCAAYVQSRPGPVGKRLAVSFASKKRVSSRDAEVDQWAVVYTTNRNSDNPVCAGMLSFSNDYGGRGAHGLTEAQIEYLDEWSNTLRDLPTTHDWGNG